MAVDTFLEVSFLQFNALLDEEVEVVDLIFENEIEEVVYVSFQ